MQRRKASKYRRESRDANHKPIVEHLRKHGIEVVETFQPVDCLVYGPKGAGWMEIKVPGRNTTFMRSQVAFMGSTKMPAAFIDGEEKALAFALHFDGALTQKEKERLAFFAEAFDKDQCHIALIERILAGEIWKAEVRKGG